MGWLPKKPPTTAAEGATQGSQAGQPAAPYNPAGTSYNFSTGQMSGAPMDSAAVTKASMSPISRMARTDTRTGQPGYKPPGGAGGEGTGGSQSGAGILENWFNQRAGGTDPAYEYGIGRASDSINRQYAARGGYNSSAATQSLSDMYANANSQRMGQLDQLAAGASGEHQRRLEDMFSQGLGLANGQAGAGQPYDMAAGGAMSAAQRQKLELMMGRAGVDQKTRQGQLDTILGAGKTVASMLGGGGGMGGGGGGGGGGGAPGYPTGDDIFRPY